MKKIELVYKEVLYNAIELKNRTLTQADLSRKLKISLSTVNSALKTIESMGAIEINSRGFKVLDIKKILYYWASIRNLQKDILYSTRIDLSVRDIEKLIPDDTIFGAYTAYKFIFNDVPADYSEVYVYGNIDLQKRFPMKKGVPNFFVLKKNTEINKFTTIANTFVDLWNMKEWYAKDFVKAMEDKLHGILE